MLAAHDVTELFGWPASLLDAIAELGSLARRGEIGIHDSGAATASCGAAGPRARGPERYPRDQVEAARSAAANAWLDRDDGSEAATRMERLATG